MPNFTCCILCSINLVFCFFFFSISMFQCFLQILVEDQPEAPCCLSFAETGSQRKQVPAAIAVGDTVGSMNVRDPDLADRNHQFKFDIISATFQFGDYSDYFRYRFFTIINPTQSIIQKVSSPSQMQQPTFFIWKSWTKTLAGSAIIVQSMSCISISVLFSFQTLKMCIYWYFHIALKHFNIYNHIFYCKYDWDMTIGCLSLTHLEEVPIEVHVWTMV